MDYHHNFIDIRIEWMLFKFQLVETRDLKLTIIRSIVIWFKHQSYSLKPKNWFSKKQKQLLVVDYHNRDWNSSLWNSIQHTDSSISIIYLQNCLLNKLLFRNLVKLFQTPLIVNRVNWLLKRCASLQNVLLLCIKLSLFLWTWKSVRQPNRSLLNTRLTL